MDDECRRVLDELDVFLDDECPDNLEEVVAVHLGDCPPCMHRADFQRTLKDLVASKCKEAAPSGLVDRVLERLRGL